VIADLQMPPAAVNRAYTHYVSRLVGDDAAAELLPVQSLLDAGALAVLSSDWEAGPLSPLGTMQRVLTRFAEPLGRLEDAISRRGLAWGEPSAGRHEITRILSTERRSTLLPLGTLQCGADGPASNECDGETNAPLP
jgi:hypothetical protein